MRGLKSSGEENSTTSSIVTSATLEILNSARGQTEVCVRGYSPVHNASHTAAWHKTAAASRGEALVLAVGSEMTLTAALRK